ncbi:MAG: type I addiction module toxin, SymE family [Candidatus Lokiarchaeota archaeon]|nr:type I addiction module toxin, SymE family [Candidatus Lokiarchaeota archaeon]
MEDKLNERHLTVSYCREDYSEEDIPFLRLKGKWMRDGGFEPGTFVKVLVMKDELVIKKDYGRHRIERKRKEKELKRLKQQMRTLQFELNKQEELF